MFGGRGRRRTTLQGSPPPHASGWNVTWTRSPVHPHKLWTSVSGLDGRFRRPKTTEWTHGSSKGTRGHTQIHRYRLKRTLRPAFCALDSTPLTDQSTKLGFIIQVTPLLPPSLLKKNKGHPNRRASKVVPGRVGGGWWVGGQVKASDSSVARLGCEVVPKFTSHREKHLLQSRAGAKRWLLLSLSLLAPSVSSD